MSFLETTLSIAHPFMLYDPSRHHRQSIRYHGYDYAMAGVYFVTICTYDHRCLFGAVVDARMEMNAFGRIVHDEWTRTPSLRPQVTLDAFVVMPNHIHGIIVIGDGPTKSDGTTGSKSDDPMATKSDGTTGSIGRRTGVLQHALPPESSPPLNQPHGPSPLRTPSQTLGAMVRGFKGAATKRINTVRGTPGAPVWQRNYWERILRTDRQWQGVRRYITENPKRWHL